MGIFAQLERIIQFQFSKYGQDNPMINNPNISAFILTNGLCAL